MTINLWLINTSLQLRLLLKDFDSSYDKDIYIVLAWQGLQATDAYSKLTQQKKDSFIKALTKYRTNNEIIECK
ncbi:hypothetical protein [Myroides marinus]|uniref:hypothetical protein n=1 Tax=Myroides marinus TaxID=703342 RepID=UPI002578C1A4|nr:hypothetical protein [Myroides marinus]MDM1370297.1 hypothetical protein [Myroides marinus]MDM1373781.1 hypothetical protein [Myroides marinus]MDM1377287.1 hypothetical protein [Myroides marinus]MDM1380724.1 hypothetical protein [Myroides marinus]MDM1384624.1 hypothetical protein [Myroides marinus]